MKIQEQSDKKYREYETIEKEHQRIQFLCWGLCITKEKEIQQIVNYI